MKRALIARRLPLVALLAFALLLLIARTMTRTSEPGKGSWLPGRRDGGGSASIDPPGPVEVGTFGTWTVRYVPGANGVREGGGVVVHLPLYWEWTPPQTASGALPGFCTVTCSDDAIGFDVEADPGFHYVRVAVTRGWLSPGDTLRFTYGDTLGGDAPGGRSRADSYAEAVQEFLVKVDGDGDGFFEEIEKSPSISLTSGPAARLRVYLKGEAVEGESTRVTVAALDRFGNRDTRYAGSIRFSHEAGVVEDAPGYTFRPEDGGAHAFALRFRSPGFHTIRVVEEGGTLQATSNPIRIRALQDSEPYVLLWGDVHQHSRLSDGTGEPEDLLRYARDVGNLDVCSVTDHDYHGLRPLDSSWERIRRAHEEAYCPGSLVTLLGYEWTSWVYGHRNVYFRDGDGDLFSSADSSTNSPKELWDALPEGNAITIAHHTGGGPMATDWSTPPPASLEPLVEICSIHGNSECYGCDKGIYSPVPGSFVQDALARGYRLGFFGSGDGHVGHPGETDTPSGGLAGIYAAGRTREAVWEALEARRTFATSGERIVLDVRLGSHRMGEEVAASELPERLVFRVVARGTAPIDVVELVENGTPIDAIVGPRESVEGSLEARKTRSGLSFYYVRVTQIDGGLAWSSPIWVSP